MTGQRTATIIEVSEPIYVTQFGDHPWTVFVCDHDGENIGFNFDDEEKALAFQAAAEDAFEICT